MHLSPVKALVNIPFDQMKNMKGTICSIYNRAKKGYFNL